ncbi:MAG: hypothetical protein AAGM22_29835 [Acidobacteriota bacterium]
MRWFFHFTALTLVAFFLASGLFSLDYELRDWRALFGPGMGLTYAVWGTPLLLMLLSLAACLERRRPAVFAVLALTYGVSLACLLFAFQVQEPPPEPLPLWREVANRGVLSGILTVAFAAPAWVVWRVAEVFGRRRDHPAAPSL